ncbi:MAG: hypothetical protein LBS42_00825 [Tannerella sp.]|nr:hypothetical protein [Tannerella sp.]
MKKLFIYFPVISLFLLGTVACDGEDGGRLSGKPVRIKSSYSDDVSFSYQGDRLLRIVENGPGSTITFGYENGELASLSFSPTDPKMADGNAYARFKKEENGNITVERGGEPDFNIYVQEIELDADNFPVKITDAGAWSVGKGGERTKEHDGEYCSLFSWDASTGLLLKEEVREIKTSQVVAVYTYKYDNAPGVMSKVDCPLWFYAYWNRQRHYAIGIYNALFSGYANNLVEATVDDDLNDRHEVLQYAFDYSSEGFPVAVSAQTSGGETLTIQIQY